MDLLTLNGWKALKSSPALSVLPPLVLQEQEPRPQC